MDLARCPICGEGNACVMQSESPGGACWCRSEEFTASLLARVPEAAVRKVCICRKCALEAQAAQPSSR